MLNNTEQSSTYIINAEQDIPSKMFTLVLSVVVTCINRMVILIASMFCVIYINTIVFLVKLIASWYLLCCFAGSMIVPHDITYSIRSLIARFMGSTWGPPGADRTQVGPMLTPWSLLSGIIMFFRSETIFPFPSPCSLLCGFMPDTNEMGSVSPYFRASVGALD